MADEPNNRPDDGRGAEQQPAPENDLAPYWAAMRRLRGADGPREPSPEERTGRLYPGEMVIATEGRVLCRIQPDGTLIVEEGYTPDRAAVALWEAVAARMPGFEARRNYLHLLELHIALLALSDEAYEAAQRAARAEGATDHDKLREELSRRSWETRVHGIVEFAREFAHLRPDLIETARRGMPGAIPPPPQGEGGPAPT